jgi:hypothetical protein
VLDPVRANPGGYVEKALSSTAVFLVNDLCLDVATLTEFLSRLFDRFRRCLHLNARGIGGPTNGQAINPLQEFGQIGGRPVSSLAPDGDNVIGQYLSPRTGRGASIPV